MRTRCGFLSDTERERIHRDSLRILAETGVRFMSGRARGILRAAGAGVDDENRVVKIPSELVAQALNTAPRSFVLGARHPKFDFAMPSAWTGYTLDGEATFAVDFRTGERRNGKVEDLVASLRIFDELPLGAVVWPNVMLSDVPLNSANIRSVCLSLMHSSKHIQHELHHPVEVPFLIEALTAVVGSESEIRRRKIFSVCYCTIPPLTHDETMCDACLELCRYHIPILPYPMPACGSTGPASLYSNIALANAESLSALVLFQLASPGCPIIMGHAAGVMNFASGGFLEGAPESALVSTGLGEMARFYGLPNTQAGCLTEAKEPGAQAVMEKMTSLLPLVLSGADVINGIGEIDTSQLLILEQIVVDHEIATMCRRLKDGIEVGDTRDFLADVLRIGPGGHFLMEDSTVEACHSGEFTVPELVDRGTYEQWQESGRPTVYTRARQKVERILAEPLQRPLPGNVVERLEDIMRRADAELPHE